MYERFTDRARKVMHLATREARRLNHEYIGTEHLLLGLIKEGAGMAANVLHNLGIDLRKIRLEVEKLIASGPSMSLGELTKRPLTPRTKKAIDYATEECRNLQHNYVGTEHLLLGLLREDEGVAAQILMNLGLSLDQVRREVLSLLGHPSDDIPPTPKPTPVVPSRSAYPRFTDRARRVMQHANQEAQRFSHEYIGTEHLLLGLLKEPSGVGMKTIVSFDVDPNRIRLDIERLISVGPDTGWLSNLPKTPRAKKVIEYALQEAAEMNHDYVGTEHVLLGLMHEQEGIAAQILMNHGLTLETLRQRVVSVLAQDSQWSPVNRLIAVAQNPPDSSPSAESPPHFSSRGMAIYKQFTSNGRSAMQIAYREAARLGHEYIGTEHFLLAIISMRHCKAARILMRHNVDLPSLRVELDRTRTAAPQANDEDDLPHTPRAKQVIEHAIEESRNFAHQHIGTEHILLGLLREADGAAGRALIEFGLDCKSLRQEVRALRRS